MIRAQQGRWSCQEARNAFQPAAPPLSRLMQTPLPPLPVLQRLFHYDPLTGALAYASDRGPRRAGDPAGSNLCGRLHLFVAGKHYPAAEIAMALYKQQDHAPLWVHAINGDYNDLTLANLALGEEKPRAGKLGRAKGSRSAKRPARDRYIRATGNGQWEARARIGGRVCYIGRFSTKSQAIAARDAAMRSIHS